MGLVDETVASDDEMEQAAHRILRTMQSAAPGAAAAAKALVLHVASSGPSDQALITHTAEELARVRLTDECAAGMRAVLAREKPPWAEMPLVYPTAPTDCGRLKGS